MTSNFDKFVRCCYSDPTYFETSVYARLGNSEEIRMLCYLCENSAVTQAKVLEYISRFDIRLDELGLDTEKGEEARRELKKLKMYVYYCCERFLGLLVKYVHPIPAFSDSCELKLDEFYNVIKIEGENYIIADETGEDWSYPSSMFEIVSRNAEAHAYHHVHYKTAGQCIAKRDAKDAVMHTAIALSLLGDKENTEEKYRTRFIEAYNLRKAEIEADV